LTTKVKAKSIKMTRTKVHARLDFIPQKNDSIESALDAIPVFKGGCFKVDPHQLYAELVPFGPFYQNIVEPLCLTNNGALAWIAAPDLLDRQTTMPLGSPFVLDAAFHAACVWGQRFANVVAFPVAIDERIMLNRTQPGHIYISYVFPIKIDKTNLVFDIRILDSHGTLFEILKGVNMRDVNGGRLYPPDWIQANGTTTMTKMKPNIDGIF
jgi:hypothetical protein